MLLKWKRPSYSSLTNVAMQKRGHVIEKQEISCLYSVKDRMADWHSSQLCYPPKVKEIIILVIQNLDFSFVFRIWTPT